MNDLTLQVKATQVDKSALTGAARKELAELEKLVKTLQNNIEQKNEGMLQAQHKQAQARSTELEATVQAAQASHQTLAESQTAASVQLQTSTVAAIDAATSRRQLEAEIRGLQQCADNAASNVALET